MITNDDMNTHRRIIRNLLDEFEIVILPTDECDDEGVLFAIAIETDTIENRENSLMYVKMLCNIFDAYNFDLLSPFPSVYEVARNYNDDFATGVGDLHDHECANIEFTSADMTMNECDSLQMIALELLDAPRFVVINEPLPCM